MRISRLMAISRKEAIHILRDPRSLGMGIAIPVLMLFLFGFALTLDVDHVPLVIWDQSESQESRNFLSRFGASRYFSIQGSVRNYAEVERAIDTNQALMALVIPVDFAGHVKSRRNMTVQLIVDGSDSNTATLAMGYADAIVRAYSQNLLIQQVQRLGRRAFETPLDLRARVWFNADMESKNYIIPGLIAVIMMVIAALLTSLTIAREWETGTMEQLISTPVKGVELVLGKFLPYFGIGMLDVVIAMLMGEFVFDVPLRGNIALIFGMAAIFLTGALSLGMVISILARSQLLASLVAMVMTFLPAFLLSGFAFDIANMPKPLQIMTNIIPARHFVTVLKGIYLKGSDLSILAPQAVLLLVFSSLMVLLANLKFRKKMV